MGLVISQKYTRGDTCPVQADDGAIGSRILI